MFIALFAFIFQVAVAREAGLGAGSRLDDVEIKITADGIALPVVTKSWTLPEGRTSAGPDGKTVYAASLGSARVAHGGGSFEFVPKVTITTDASGKQVIGLSMDFDNRASGMFASPKTQFDTVITWKAGGVTYEVDNQVYTSCMDGETPVTLWDGQVAPIAELAPGEFVFNPVTGEALEIAAIIRGPEPGPLVDVSWGGGTVRFSLEHPVLTSHGLVRAADVERGVQLRTVAGWVTVIDVSTLPAPPGQRVYNLRFARDSGPDEHYFLARGIVVGDYLLQAQLSR